MRGRSGPSRRGGCAVRRRRLRLLACLVVVMFVGSAPGSAAAFGTIDTGGQRREHERLTRAALACAGGAGSDAFCFAPGSIDYLAGHGRESGLLAPDSDELSDPAAHCDNADFLQGGYPHTRDQATATLVACVNHLSRSSCPRPGYASLQHAQLMAQHEDFDLFVVSERAWSTIQLSSMASTW